MRGAADKRLQRTIWRLCRPVNRLVSRRPAKIGARNGRRSQPLHLAPCSSGYDREHGWMVRYLKEENRIPRARLPERISVTRKERNRLPWFGRDLGVAVHQIVTIVSPNTFLRW